MEPVSLPFFYQLGASLSPLAKMELKTGNRIAILIAAVSAQSHVNNLLKWSGDLKVCRARASAFVSAVNDIFQWWRVSQPDAREKEDWEVDSKFSTVIDNAKTLETVLSEELATLSTYSVSKKGAYLTNDLVAQAENVFPSSVLKSLNQEIRREVREAGKCLAFDIPTASGFHMLRATEGVLHEYYLAICKPPGTEKLANWGAYIAALYKLTDGKELKEKTTSKTRCTLDAETKSHVKKVLALLQQVKDGDRNQIMHLEEVLSDDQAFKLFDITKTAIMVMAEKLPAIGVKNTTSKS